MKEKIPWILFSKIIIIIFAILKYFSMFPEATWMELFLLYCLLTVLQREKDHEEK